MRQTTISGITISYPDDIIWVNDHAPVVIEGANPVGAEITVVHPTGTTKTLTYMSPLTELTFYLDTTLKSLHNGNIGDYACQMKLYSNGSYVSSFSFYFKLYDGKSFQDRTHGTSQHIYVYDPSELIKLHIFSPSSGIAQISGNNLTLEKGLNSFNLSTYITNPGTYQLCLRDTNNETIETQIIADEPINPTDQNLILDIDIIVENQIIGGNIFGSKTIFPICHTIEMIETCSGYPVIELMYTDCDGCIRYLGGTIVSDTSSTTLTSYTQLDNTPYKDVPRTTLTDGSQLIKIHFADIDIRSNFNDILYSENLYVRRPYDGEFVPVKLKTNSLSIKSNDDVVDFDIEIYYMD